jgi:aminoglycoside 6'-N-acetyltransferase I
VEGAPQRRRLTPRPTAMVTVCRTLDQPGWLALREQLWPHCTREEHLAEMATFLAAPRRFAQFIEYGDAGVPLGFIEVAIRSDYVNGTESSPVAFLEGIFVAPEARGRGVARRLVAEAEHWARFLGCSELASDAPLENTSSHAMHAALGFVETERVVFFRKTL